MFDKAQGKLRRGIEPHAVDWETRPQVENEYDARADVLRIGILEHGRRIAVGDSGGHFILRFQKAAHAKASALGSAASVLGGKCQIIVCCGQNGRRLAALKQQTLGPPIKTRKGFLPGQMDDVHSLHLCGWGTANSVQGQAPVVARPQGNSGPDR